MKLLLNILIFSLMVVYIESGYIQKPEFYEKKVIEEEKEISEKDLALETLSKLKQNVLLNLLNKGNEIKSTVMKLLSEGKLYNGNKHLLGGLLDVEKEAMPDLSNIFGEEKFKKHVFKGSENYYGDILEDEKEIKSDGRNIYAEEKLYKGSGKYV